MAANHSLMYAPAALRMGSVLQQFPPVAYAFAYGSGAHYQPGLYDNVRSEKSTSTASHLERVRHDASTEPSVRPRQDCTLSNCETSTSASSNTLSFDAFRRRGQVPVIDFIFTVKDAHEWHQQASPNTLFILSGSLHQYIQNISRNSDHYSWVGRLGPKVVCSVAEAIGVGVHFNALVQMNGQMTIKYGVVEAATLERDLSLWEHLYIAGRMHKPVTPLLPAPPGPLAAAQETNLHNALAAALVLLPPTFTEEELLRTLVGLSYRGDIRLAIGAEDPNKVARIVDGSWDELYSMYMPLLIQQSGRYSTLKLEVMGQVAPTSAMRSGGGANSGCRLWRQSKDAEAQGAALQLLAPGLLHEMAARLGYHVPLEHLAPGTSTQKEVVAAAMRSGAVQRLTADSLAAIVRRSSIYQAAAGLLAAGGGKAVQYVGSKMAKAVRPLFAMAIPAGGNATGHKNRGVS
ncbi:hypothetical protein VaNZ11_007130 [Volvox africanus]|uniref:Phosphatidate cytidylyltransferase, mitochondrial n=1 Tax=Volvox africanus TaxID=51714 RepID=A0ABQ5S272_9CHLO|nr:hypothetical protein VaNZ11_007130 [Volvox africanus]